MLDTDMVAQLDGPTLLSRIPANAPDKPQKDMPGWGRMFTHLESRMGMLPISYH